MKGTIGNRTRALLYDSYLPLEWWHYALDTAVYLINRSPTFALENCTPYERWHERKPDLKYIRRFGSLVRVLVPEETRKKLDKQAWTGILVGFTPTGYKIYDVKSRDYDVSRHVLTSEKLDIRSLTKDLVQDRTQKLHLPNKIDLNNIENVIVNSCLIYREPITISEAL